MDKAMTRLSLLLVVISLLPVAGCNTQDWHAGPAQTESHTVKLGDAKSVQVEIEMPGGELDVGDGARELLEADFSYGSLSSKPQVEYNVSGGRGRLMIRQPGSAHGRGSGHNKWDLHLSNKVPLELKVKQGAGRVNLTLAGLSLTRVDFDLGAGEVNVDLTGDWKSDLTANLNGGAGKATIRLPRDVGVRATAHGGIGSINAHDLKKDGDAYVNDAYGKSPVTLRVNVEGGVGEINLELGGAPPSV